MSHVLSRIGRRRALRGAAAGLVVLGLLLWWVAPWREEAPGGTITMSTGTRAGVYQKYGELLRTALHKDMPDLQVRLETSDGSWENVRRVATGQADFALAAADAVETYRQEGRAGADGLRGWRACTTTTCSSPSRPTRASVPSPTCGASGSP